MSTTPTKQRKPGRPRTKTTAAIHVRSYMGDYAVADVTEPGGLVRQWVLPVSILPAAARPSGKEFAFKQGDHVLYTQQVMPAVVRVPFYRLLQAKRRGNARRQR